MQIKAILFDKDGTLFDFEKTWSSWTIGIIDHYAEGNSAKAQEIADTIQFDLTARNYLPTSPIIAGTNRQAAELVASVLPNHDVDAVEAFMAQSASQAPLAPVVPLRAYCQGLAAQGYKLGVMTNDSERSALAHLKAAEISDIFDMIIGFDSGYGAKPDPDPLLAFAKHIKIAPENIAMVGDSTHDLIAGRRAGMITIGVLTGLARQTDLAPYADIVLPHIGHIPDHLAHSEAAFT